MNEAEEKYKGSQVTDNAFSGGSAYSNLKGQADMDAQNIADKSWTTQQASPAEREAYRQHFMATELPSIESEEELNEAIAKNPNLADMKQEVSTAAKAQKHLEESKRDVEDKKRENQENLQKAVGVIGGVAGLAGLMQGMRDKLPLDVQNAVAFQGSVLASNGVEANDPQQILTTEDIRMDTAIPGKVQNQQQGVGV